jgi:hypothetical protein
VAVGTENAGAVKVVEQGKLARKAVMVGRDVLAENAQLRVAVALLHVAEHLIIGPVLLDDIDDVLEHARLAMTQRNGSRRNFRARLFQAGEAVRQSVVRVHFPGILRQRLVIGDRDD